MLEQIEGNPRVASQLIDPKSPEDEDEVEEASVAAGIAGATAPLGFVPGEDDNLQIEKINKHSL